MDKPQHPEAAELAAEARELGIETQGDEREESTAPTAEPVAEIPQPVELESAKEPDDTLHFEIVEDKGTVTGTYHLYDPKTGAPNGEGNQDYFGYRRRKQFAVGVVSDGCSGGRTQTGSTLLVTTVLNATTEIIERSGVPEDPQQFVTELERRLLAAISKAAKGYQGEGSLSFEDILAAYFSATLLAIVITNRWTIVIGSGDGVYHLNGETTVLKPKIGNGGQELPPYLIYLLYGNIPKHFTREDLGLKIHVRMATENLKSWAVATDGARLFVDAPDTLVPGTTERIGSFGKLLDGMRHRRQNDASVIAPLLTRANTPSRELRTASGTDRVEVVLDDRPGVLKDDTTIVAGTMRRSRVSFGPGKDDISKGLMSFGGPGKPRQDSLPEVRIVGGDDPPILIGGNPTKPAESKVQTPDYRPSKSGGPGFFGWFVGLTTRKRDDTDKKK